MLAPGEMARLTITQLLGVDFLEEEITCDERAKVTWREERNHLPRGKNDYTTNDIMKGSALWNDN